MKDNKITLASATESIKPPPRKKDVLKATAQVMFEDHQKAREAAAKVKTRLLEVRDKAFTREAKRRISTAKIEVTKGWETPQDHIRVDFKVTIPISVAQKEFDDHKKAPDISYVSFEDFLKKLTAASQSNSAEVSDLLAIPGMKKKLLEAGNRVLNGGDSGVKVVEV